MPLNFRTLFLLTSLCTVRLIYAQDSVDARKSEITIENFGKAPGKNLWRPVSPADASSGSHAGADHLKRWIELQMATIFARYRFTENSAGVTTANQLQYKGSFKGRIKFDERGHYSLHAGVFSGRNFVATWNNTGLGTGDAQSNLALKQLYFSALPVNGVELQYGGLYVSRGESTEITTYDDDGYLVGERLILKRPDKIFFDEASVTYAYLGDTNTPNLNKRYHRLRQSNYHQFLVSKKLGKRFAASFDYTFVNGAETLREAVKVQTKEAHILDFVRFETYQRVDVKPDFGFALYGEKAIHSRLAIGGGYAQIDPNYGGLNADRFGSGKRFWLIGNLQLSSEFTVSTYLTHTISRTPPGPLHIRFDLILNYNLLKTLQRTGAF